MFCCEHHNLVVSLGKGFQAVLPNDGELEASKENITGMFHANEGLHQSGTVNSL